MNDKQQYDFCYCIINNTAPAKNAIISYIHLSHKTTTILLYYLSSTLTKNIINVKNNLVNRISDNYFINQMQMSNNKTLNYIL